MAGTLTDSQIPSTITRDTEVADAYTDSSFSDSTLQFTFTTVDGSTETSDSLSVLREYKGEDLTSSTSFLAGDYTIVSSNIYMCITATTLTNPSNAIPSHANFVHISSQNTDTDTTYQLSLSNDGATLSLVESGGSDSITLPLELPTIADGNRGQYLRVNTGDNDLDWVDVETSSNSGAWDSSTDYTTGQIVTHDSMVWVAIADSTNVEPGSSGGREEWLLLRTGDNIASLTGGYYTPGTVIRPTTSNANVFICRFPTDQAPSTDSAAWFFMPRRGYVVPINTTSTINYLSPSIVYDSASGRMFYVRSSTSLSSTDILAGHDNFIELSAVQGDLTETDTTSPAYVVGSGDLPNAPTVDPVAIGSSAVRGSNIEYATSTHAHTASVSATLSDSTLTVDVGGNTDDVDLSSLSGTSGATDFTGLDDTPATYGTAGQIIVINTDADGLDWDDLPDVPSLPTTGGTSSIISNNNDATERGDSDDAARANHTHVGASTSHLHQFGSVSSIAEVGISNDDGSGTLYTRISHTHRGHLGGIANQSSTTGDVALGYGSDGQFLTTDGTTASWANVSLTDTNTEYGLTYNSATRIIGLEEGGSDATITLADFAAPVSINTDDDSDNTGNFEGSENTYSRSDHVHNVDFSVSKNNNVLSLQIGDQTDTVTLPLPEITASDRGHFLRVDTNDNDTSWFDLLTDTAVSSIGTANSAGNSNNAARRNHVHTTTVSGSLSGEDLTISVGGNDSSTIDLSSLNPDLPFATTGTPAATGSTGARGTSTNVARFDHRHVSPQLSSASPQNIAGTANAGTAATSSRADHRHVGATATHTHTGFASSTHNHDISLIDLTDTPSGYGTDGQILQTNGTDAVAWVDSPTDNDTTYGLSISGNTLNLVEGGTDLDIDIPTELPTLGTSGQVLAVNSDADDTEWVEVDSGSSISTTDGDIQSVGSANSAGDSDDAASANHVHSGLAFQTLTQTAYDALSTYDSNTLYLITG